jgi:arabinose-5-phosphate isomerase
VLDAARARAIRLIGFDVDGVLTDNGIYVAVEGGARVETKRFSALDGVGFHFLRRSGIEVAWVSGRTSAATAERARELGIEQVIQDAGLGFKLPAVTELLARRGVAWDEFAFVGDDLADVPVLRRAGLPIGVANAVPEVRALAAWITEREGGHGAAREVIEALLRARGEWDRLVADYLRSGVMTLSDEALIAEARRVLELEAREVASAGPRLGAPFARAVRLLAAAQGRVIVSGVGKSGIIARKIAATMTSTGTPATYLHPVDSLHGDLGIVGRDDAAILLSKSGNTEELFGLVAALQRLQVPIVALTGGRESALARAAAVVLDASVAEEACPHDLAPTTSTTVALAIGDALAVALLTLKGFRRDDFAALHPGGSLGRRLHLRVRDVMIPVGHPLRAGSTMREAVMSLAAERGLAVVLEGNALLGVLTTGDLARLAERRPDFLGVPVTEVMTRAPKTAEPGELAAAAVGRMEQHGIMSLPVVEGGNVAGVVHLHDLLRAGAV